MSEGDIDEFGGLEVHCQGGRAMKDQKGLMTSHDPVSLLMMQERV